MFDKKNWQNPMALILYTKNIESTILIKFSKLSTKQRY